jgi:Poly-beta-hydroxybutyrate polymerase N terminal
VAGPSETAAAIPAPATPIPSPAVRQWPGKIVPAGTVKVRQAFGLASDAGPRDSIGERHSHSITAFSEAIDRSLNAAAAHFTMGLSPAAPVQAYLDWATHLAFSPGKRLQLIDRATRKGIRFACQLCLSLAAREFGGQTLCRTPAARQALSRGRLAEVAVQLHLSGLLAQPAMVAYNWCRSWLIVSGKDLSRQQRIQSSRYLVQRHTQQASVFAQIFERAPREEGT